MRSQQMLKRRHVGVRLFGADLSSGQNGEILGLLMSFATLFFRLGW